MLSFVQSWLTPGANPIGVDFGSGCLRLAQVGLVGNEFRLIAAASTDVPPQFRDDTAGRLGFFTQTLRDLLTQSNFQGRRAILSLPASCMQICHARLTHLDEPSLLRELPAAVRGRLPIEPEDALLRHIVAGQITQDGQIQDEIIIMAARRKLVDELLHAAAKARLDVIAMNVEPKAIVDCFSHVYRRKADAESTSCYIDIGGAATRAVIARGGQILFARILRVASDALSGAVALALGTTLEDARVLRIKKHLAEAKQADGAWKNTGATPAEKTCDADESDRAALHGRIDQACAAPLEELVASLAECRRDHEATFPGAPIDRLIFIGGEARDLALCRQIAGALQIPAQVGDPLVRMARISDISVESGIDRRSPQPAWTVAIGLSMGPVAAPVEQVLHKAS
jgi:Tfp pilus assembly PilM family ATPase